MHHVTHGAALHGTYQATNKTRYIYRKLTFFPSSSVSADACLKRNPQAKASKNQAPCYYHHCRNLTLVERPMLHCSRVTNTQQGHP